MIIPAPAILRLVAATLIPVALLYAVTPQFRPMLLFVPPLVGIVALADLLALFRYRNRLTVTAPSRLSLVCGRPGQLGITIRAINQAGFDLQVGLALPAGFASPFREARLKLAKGGDAVCLDWPLTGTKRAGFRSCSVPCGSVLPSACGSCRSVTPSARNCGSTPTCGQNAAVWQACFWSVMTGNCKPNVSGARDGV